ncbi:probable pseudouridine-5'-phosphatase [Cylas formicarius]|uniref:probable pseudouridine-5'-phosphatase n=1 Tax=Cylas formicarius TaxID=197179 RepID=UPI002958CD0A|nr:probable pseudouridine-5'-phosphatase [Cylas formicarius]
MIIERIAPKFKRATHVIFDLDGTLLDTERVYFDAIAAIAKRFGKEYTHGVAAKVVGTVERESCRIAISEMALPISVDEFQREFRNLSQSHFKNNAVSLLPGAASLIRHLSQNKIPIAIATSSSEDSVRLKISAHRDLFKLFSHIVCGGSDPEVKAGKPSPDVFLVCANRFLDVPPPRKCLAFEDAPNGVRAAVDAGMQVVMIADHSVQENFKKEATLTVDSLANVPLHNFGLPAL